MNQIRIIEYGTPEYGLTVKLREEILRIPLGLTFSVEDFTEEYKDIHIACFSNYNELLGCLILSPIDKGTLKMRQVAVSTSVQRSGVGRAMVLASEKYAIENEISKIVLNARAESVPFYNHLQYRKIGESFVEVGIEHYKMEKIL